MTGQHCFYSDRLEDEEGSNILQGYNQEIILLRCAGPLRCYFAFLNFKNEHLRENAQLLEHTASDVYSWPSPRLALTCCTACTTDI